MAIPKHGADVNATTTKSEFALVRAIKCNNRHMAQTLIGSGAKLDCKDNRGYSLLMCAAESGFSECVSMLLRGGAFVGQVTTRFNETALTLAAGNGHCDCVRLLLHGGASVNHVTTSDETALIRAARYGHDVCVRLLIENGGTIDVRLRNGKTALMCAANHGHSSTIDLLLSNGASIDLLDSESQSALMLAAKRNHVHAVRLLLVNKASINLQSAHKQYTALSLSVSSEEITKELIARGVTIDWVDKKGRTSLMRAAKKGYDRVVRLLLDFGASVDAKDRDDSTAMMLKDTTKW